VNEKEMPHKRDPERTRTAILDAAEEVFADQGYEAASLHEIAERAGVSRGTPSYFFGSKDGLYHAVLERAFANVWAEIGETHSAALKGAKPAEAIAADIEAYLRFLVDHPRFVRLVQWEALHGGRVLREVNARLTGVENQISLIKREVERGAIRPVAPDLLLVSLVALAWFPVAHADTLLFILGIDPRDPKLIDRYVAHLREFVLHGIAAESDRSQPAPAVPANDA
jgi:TetR/AcrR family transcriptional regulator